MHSRSTTTVASASGSTHHAQLKDVVNFNNWLGEPDHKYKIVINGNHEHNAPWKHEVRTLLSNATHFLCDESCVIECPTRGVAGKGGRAADAYHPRHQLFLAHEDAEPGA